MTKETSIKITVTARSHTSMKDVKLRPNLKKTL